MRSMRAFLVAGGLVVLAACRVGSAASDSPVATSPYGARVQLHAGGSSWSGELLAVRVEGLLLQLADRRIAFAPWTSIGRVELHRAPGLDRVDGGTVPLHRDLERMRLVSRYVYGVDEAQLGRLLAGRGQEALDTIPPAGSPGSPAASPTTDPAGSPPPAFVEAVRRTTRRYRDRSEAVAAGYRRLGPDFPGMGEHWVHPGRVVAGSVDPERPPVLGYVDVDGRARLVGVAFTLPLGPDEEPPAGPLPVSAWHDHTGDVDAETLLLNHPASAGHGDGHGARSYRLSMVHLWTELSNPDGLLAQNNWALPFWKRGLTPPEPVDPEAARGLSLADDGREFYRALLRRAAVLGPDEAARIETILDRHADRAETWVARERRSGGGDVRELTRIWRSLWQALRGAVPEATWTRLAPLAPRAVASGSAPAPVVPRPGGAEPR